MIISSKCQVQKKWQLSENLNLYEFSIEKYIPWEPGMFFYLNIENDRFKKDWSNVRPFSFASYGNQNARMLIRKKEGYTAKIFEELEINDEFHIKYPFGDFFLNSPSNKFIIAGGSGISPFLAYIDWVHFHNVENKNVIFHSAKYTCEGIEKFPIHITDRFVVNQFITREKYLPPFDHRIEVQNILDLREKTENFEYYLCGSGSFIKNLFQGLNKAGYKKIFYEFWD